jgi:hypothetical protein
LSIAIITGSAGLIGSEAALYFAQLGLDIIGIDNDMRSFYFGPEASTDWNRARLETKLGKQYVHHNIVGGWKNIRTIWQGHRPGNSYRSSAISRLGGARTSDRLYD